MKKTTLGVLLAGTASLAASALPANAQDGTFSLGGGFDYSRGDYGTSTTTEIFSIPLFGKYETGPWIFKLTVPYIQINGPGNVIPGVGRVKAVKGNPNIAPSTNTTESGLGDIVAAATYNVYSRGASDPVIDLTGKIKFGTADKNKGLGTGENDYSAQVDVYQSFGRFTALVGAGYSILGSSDQIPLNNVFYGSVGGLYKFDNRISGGLLLDFRQAASSTSGSGSEATAYAAYKLADTWKAHGYILTGFASGSPDWGIGANIAHSF